MNIEHGPRALPTAPCCLRVFGIAWGPSATCRKVKGETTAVFRKHHSSNLFRSSDLGVTLRPFYMGPARAVLLARGGRSGGEMFENVKKYKNYL
jgi:hypothetical protein